MKRLLPFFIATIVLAACNSTPKDAATLGMASTQPEAQPTMMDTTGLAEYQAWKVENELRDVRDMNTPDPTVTAKPAKTTKKTKKAQSSHAALPQSSRSSSSTPQTNIGSEVANDSGSMKSGAGNEAQATKKEGVSKAAKGAVIGGVVGAGAGAVINKKNRVVGAVVGAVIGAGGGYVLGRKMDKKEGRY